MNIFYLDQNIYKCAEYHCNSHVIKMISEYSQLLSNAIHISTGNIVDVKDKELFKSLYPNAKTTTIKPTHINHPCSVWVRESKQNFNWLLSLLDALHNEWAYRYEHKDKLHASYYKLIDGYTEPKLPNIGLTNRPQTIPTQYQNKDVVQAYRDYYIGDKQHILKYTKRNKPDWLN